MLYHCTDAGSAREILADGVIRARAVEVYRDHLGPARGEPPVQLAPAVWFTRADSCPTVAAKLRLAGWPLEKPGTLWRFAVADETVPLDLPAWARPHGYAPSLFRWMLLTAELAGEDYEDWRLAAGGVPREQWLAVESLQGEGWRREE